MLRKFATRRVAKAFALALSLLVLLLSFFWFQRSLINYFTELSLNSLQGNASLYASIFSVKLKDQLAMLEGQTRYFLNVDMGDYNSMKRAIMATHGIGDFKRIAVANASGTTMNYEGKSSGNIMMQDYFKEAMAGRDSVSQRFLTDEDGDEVLVLAVPIKQNGKTVGAITGSFERSVLTNIFDFDDFVQNGSVLVFDASGNIMTTSDAGHLLMDEGETLDDFAQAITITSGRPKERILRDFYANAQGTFSFKYKGTKRICAYCPVGVHKWMIIVSIPQENVQRQINRVVFIVMVLILVVAAVVSFLLLLLYRGNCKAVEIKKQNREYQLEKYKLKRMAEQDLLTGLTNKVVMEQKSAELLAALPPGAVCALIIIDLDNFKQINDKMGHLMGDFVIEETASKLSRIFSADDYVARIGGDEFAVLMRFQNGSAEGCRGIIVTKALAVCKALLNTYSDGKSAVETSASVGIAVYGEDGMDYKTLFGNADRALYASKNGGKNRYTFFAELPREKRGEKK